jgi:predicted flap endonuclease-1-like 5' DNA nuclease
MNNADMKNGPHFEMWVIGIAAGLVAAAVMYVVGQYGFMAAAFVGALVALIVGAVFGFPKSKPEPLPVVDAIDVEAHAAPVAAAPAVAASVMAAPAMAEAAPAAFVAMPVAEAKPARAPSAAKPAAAKPAAAKPTAAKPAAAEPATAKPARAPKPKKDAGPLRLTAPRKGKADDLKEIEGIGPAMEKLVNGMGFYHFDQIAGWSDADVALVDAEMKTFKGRILRDKWVAQAKIIVAEGLDAFRERAKTNNY